MIESSSETQNETPAPHGWNSHLVRYLMAREHNLFDQAVTDIFGFYALQIGLPQYTMLEQTRIPNCWSLDFDAPAQVFADPHALPFPEDSLDLIALPHTLEFTDDPHQILREAHRALRAEGRLLITGFNPYSLFGLCRRLHKRDEPPWNNQFISPYRLKDWLSLLGFDLAGGAFAVYVPPFANEKWLHRAQWFEKAGDRWWPIAGGIYFLHAIKKVVGLRLVTSIWKRDARRRNWAAAHRMPQEKNPYET
ncbi:MAG: class I SAM-dependent methyltransferase [Burkholderiales bacterium]|jgi:SAM-dependent methyltransferase|nr:class I SAM-dependent methyltransferase [Burkholderiales bacterium]